MTVVGYVPGGFDMFHIGHLNIIDRARERCDLLVVGVVTDELLLEVKGSLPVIPQSERMAIVAALASVDEVISDTAQDKRIAWHSRPYDVLFKGDDWKGTPKGDRLEAEMAEIEVRICYLPYTAETSSTMLRSFLVQATGGAA
jgi:glycerol-3-phosphate cytidylyltransferase